MADGFQIHTCFHVSALKLKQSGRHFADDLFQMYSLDKPHSSLIQFSLTRVHRNNNLGPSNNKSVLLMV